MTLNVIMMIMIVCLLTNVYKHDNEKKQIQLN